MPLNVYKMKKRIVLRYIFAAMLVALFIFVFLMSAENADKSTSTSGRLIAKFADIFSSDYKSGSIQVKALIIAKYQHLVRKLAHFTVYFLIGVCGFGFFKTFEKVKLYKCCILSYICGTLYSVTDEIHQFFVPGRAAQVTDVLLDSAGVLCGTLIFAVSYIIINKIRGRRNATGKR